MAKEIGIWLCIHFSCSDNVIQFWYCICGHLYYETQRIGDSAEIIILAWHAGALGAIPGQGRHGNGIFGVEIWLWTLGTVYRSWLGDHINFDPVSIWYVKHHWGWQALSVCQWPPSVSA